MGKLILTRIIKLILGLYDVRKLNSKDETQNHDFSSGQFDFNKTFSMIYNL